jgi:hypothetical protein
VGVGIRRSPIAHDLLEGFAEATLEVILADVEKPRPAGRG